MHILDYDQKTKKMTEILPTEHFMTGVLQSTWYVYATRKEKAQFIEILASGLDKEEFITVEQATEAISIAISYNLRTRSNLKPISLDSARIPAKITMDEILKLRIPAPGPVAPALR